MGKANLCGLLMTLIIILGLKTATKAAEMGFINGVVKDKSTKAPLFGVNVIFIGMQLGGATDRDGYYLIENVPPGTHKLRLSMIGYKQVRMDVTVLPNTETKVDVELQQTVIPLREIVVTPGKFGIRRESGAADQVLEVNEIKLTPGAAGDVYMVMSTLPGATSQGPTSPIYVRGGSSDENLVLLDNGSVSSPFHCEIAGGGMYSMFNPAILREVTLLTGGFPAEYGGKLSAVLDIEGREGDRERLSGSAALTMAYAELVGEGPVSPRGSYIFSARRSYFDLLVKMSEYKFEVFPNYSDLYGKLVFDLTKNHKLSFTALWANDNLVMPYEEPDFTGDFDWETTKGLFSLGLRSFFSPRIFSRFTLTRSDSRWKTTFGSEWYDDTKEVQYAVREDVICELSPLHKLKFGLSLKQLNSNYSINMPDVREQERIREDAPLIRIDSKVSSRIHGFYLQDKWRISNWWVANIGERYDYFDESGEHTISPRFGLAYALGKGTVFRAAWGYYFQSLSNKDLTTNYGNPNLKPKKATHYLLGLEHRFREGINLRAEAYYKRLTNLPLSNTNTNFSNEGYGYAKGIEFLVQRHLKNNIFGWTSYSYSVVKRREYDDLREDYPDFDRRHILSVVGNYKFRNGWRIGLKWQYASGRPLTPIVGAEYDSLSGWWKPVWGERSSVRYPAYHLLDVRVLKEFRFSHWNLITFLEVMNAYNRKNVAEYEWNTDYTERTSMTFFPILPVIGIIAEF